jgi:murein DD-endopeptidase MepM/ murein hydrolase activator NlpD
MKDLPKVPFGMWSVVGLLFIAFVINGISFKPPQSKTSIAGAYSAISQGYSSGHSGIDITADNGAPVESLSDGKVIKIADEDKYCPGKGYGKLVMIEDSKGDHTFLYAHLGRQLVDYGDEVKNGDTIGTVGMTGRTTGPHLHLTVFKTETLKTENHACGGRLTGETINPARFLKIE